MTLTEQVKLADDLYHAAFAKARTARSHAYRMGVRDLLQAKATGCRLGDEPLRWEAGTAELDAWFAGVEEGHRIWERPGT